MDGLLLAVWCQYGLFIKQENWFLLDWGRRDCGTQGCVDALSFSLTTAMF